MAQLVKRFACIIPAGTLQSANFAVQCGFPASQVQQINIRVPPGPRGNVGFRIGSGGNPIFPDNAGGYVITDNDYITWPVTGQPDAGSWELEGYNNGQYDHVIYVEFLLSPIGSNSLPAPSSVPAIVGAQVTG